MRRIVLALILSLAMIFSISAQSPMDLVLFLDTSASMSESYNEVRDYLTGPFIREFLRTGDTFHLVSFSDKPRVEISRRVEGVGDVETIIGRMLLMYPLDPGSDIPAALRFAETYTVSLPGSRQKKIVFITDSDPGLGGIQKLVDETAARLKNQGVDIQYVRFPLSGSGPSSGRSPARIAAPPRTEAQTPAPSVAREVPRTPETPVRPPAVTPPPPVQQPPAAEPARRTPVPPPLARTAPQQPPSREEAAPPSPGTAAPPPPGVRPPPPETAGIGEAVIPPAGAEMPAGEPAEASGGEPVPAVPPPAPEAQVARGAPPTPEVRDRPSSVPPVSRAEPGSAGDIPLPLIILLGVLALLALGALIFFVSRRLHNGPGRVVAQAAAGTPPADREAQTKSAELLAGYAARPPGGTPPLSYPPPKRRPLPRDRIEENHVFEGPPMLNLFVEDQNTAIGRRNIHVVKAGNIFTLGGGKSDFLIFLVPVPPHIAELHFDGHQCTLIPRKSQYFPDIGSQQVPNCIGKTVRVISDKNYELHIRIERYQDPLLALNKLLNSISVPG